MAMNSFKDRRVMVQILTLDKLLCKTILHRRGQRQLYLCSNVRAYNIHLTFQGCTYYIHRAQVFVPFIYFHFIFAGDGAWSSYDAPKWGYHNYALWSESIPKRIKLGAKKRHKKCSTLRHVALEVGLLTSWRDIKNGRTPFPYVIKQSQRVHVDVMSQ